RIDRLSALTRLTGLEDAVIQAARACRAAPDSDRTFPHLAQQIREIVCRFEECGAVGSAMWNLLSSEYWSRVPGECGDLEPVDERGDLRELVARVEELASDEERLRAANERLRSAQPPTPEGGRFDPARHRDYLALFPASPPKSERARALFVRFARQE